MGAESPTSYNPEDAIEKLIREGETGADFIDYDGGADGMYYDMMNEMIDECIAEKNQLITDMQSGKIDGDADTIMYAEESKNECSPENLLSGN